MQTANILLLCDEAARHTGTVDEHILAFKRYSTSRVVVVDSRAAAALDIDLNLFDAIVFHYSIAIAIPSFLPPPLTAKLAAFPRPRILFIQDEYRWVDRTAAAIRDLGISVVFTVVNGDVVRKIYREPWFDSVRFVETLTGFVPENLLAAAVPEYASRPIDVSYRARKVPSWLGSFSQEKWIIGEKFLAGSARYDLQCDIAMSESSRIYGQAWIDFVANSKAVLGTESGASFIDFSGDAQRQVDDFERLHPTATFKEIQSRFLPGDGEATIHVISPRCFEAAALRTLMILYPGTYSGVLQPHRHYVPLARDHSNMDEVVEVVRDPARAGAIIRAAFDEVACSPTWTFKAFIATFDRVLGEEIAKFRSAGGGGQIADVNPNDREQLYARLEADSWRISLGQRKATSIALRLQRFSNGLDRAARAVLPRSLANRAISAALSLKQRLKPALKRMLFGRE